MNLNLRICSVVVLYNPNGAEYDNIKTYASSIDKLIVIDNSTIHNKLLINRIQNDFNNIMYINNNDNLGIATALNIACDRAIQDGYDWILTMDQDSGFVNFEAYKKCFIENIQRDNQIGIVTLNHTHKMESLDFMNCEYREEDVVITSGNFVNLSLFNQVGRFDDSLFIDMVDYDFSHKMILGGFKIIKLKNHYLIHQLGEVFKRKNIFTGKVKAKIEHSPQRIYYMTRNRLYISKRYEKQLPKEYNFFKTFNTLFIHKLAKIILYENQKLKKIYAKFLGLFHFLIGKNGKYNL